MAEKPTPGTLLQLSPEALFRHQVVSAVRAKCLGGVPLAAAVSEVAAQPQLTLQGTLRGVSARSIRRWLDDHATAGLAGLETARPAPRPVSQVLPTALLDFLRTEKGQDRYASVPELLRRARLRGVIGATDHIDRTTVWRTCRRLALPLRRVPAKREADMRRFAYPHRMMMTLADGKHFRAGPRRTRRVALFFLDDAVRYGLRVVVGTSESAALFLRGLYEVIQRHGFMDILFLDRGPGFIADDTVAACQRLGINLIWGTKQYPEGHGAIERFNQTAGSQVLRGLVGAADVDDACGALELRLQHYLTQQYDLQPHEALDGLTPQARWDADPRPLRFPTDDHDLRDRFIVCETRKVSTDNVISHASIDYEVPRGHADTTVEVWRRLLTGELLVPHDGQLVTLHPVDLAGNATARRARPQAPPPADDEGTPMTAAQLAFTRDFGPAVGPDGGYRPPTRKE